MASTKFFHCYNPSQYRPYPGMRQGQEEYVVRNWPERGHFWTSGMVCWIEPLGAGFVDKVKGEFSPGEAGCNCPWQIMVFEGDNSIKCEDCCVECRSRSLLNLEVKLQHRNSLGKTLPNTKLISDELSCHVLHAEVHSTFYIRRSQNRYVLNRQRD